MIALHPEYIIDQSEHKKAVVLPFNEWETLMSDIEELEDIRAFDAAKSSNDPIISFEQAVKEIKNNAIK
ncbi:MAG: hypothetical protein KOO69_01735 [Victivallales bacterium]|nr:hypothetical protein [Victivallales bacterium]